MFTDRLTTTERMKALALMQGLDRVPINPFASAYTAAVTGLPLKEFFLEPEKAWRAQIWSIELHQYDATPSFNIPNWAGWDFGGELIFPETPAFCLPVLGKRAVEKLEDVENLELPDLDRSPGVSRLLEFAKLSRERGSRVSIPAGSALGIAGNITSPANLFRWFYKYPDLVHRILRISTDYILAIADRLIEEFGAENCSAFIAYPFECQTMMSSKFFEKYSLPYIMEIHSKLIRKGVNKWVVHLCGDHTKNLPFWLNEIQLAPRTTITIGHEMDIEQTAKAFGEDHIIGGNVHTNLLQQGSPDQVFEVSGELIRKMKGHPGGFILMPACGLPPLTPPANVYAMVKAARVFGQY